MENHTNHFTPLLIVVFLAFIVPVVLARFKKLRLPIVVGEILAGILIGRSGFGWVSAQEPILDFIAEFGFVFLMFLSGMEIDFSSLGLVSGKIKARETQRYGPVSLGTASFGLTIILAALISTGLVQLGLARNLWMMGLILSTTSLGVVVPILKENGLIRGPFGQSLLAAIVVKVVPAMVFRLRFCWREAFSAGALLSARLSLIIAAAAVGVRLGAISPATNAAIVLVAILTVTLAPVAFSALAPPRESKAHRPMIVVGAGELGLQIAEQLRAHQEHVIILDGDESQVERARRHFGVSNPAQRRASGASWKHPTRV